MIVVVLLGSPHFSQDKSDARIESEGSSPRIVISRVKLLGRYSQVRSDDEVKEVIEYPENVKITWKDSFIVVEFEIQNSVDPEKNEYAYKIIGRDEDWIHIGNKNYLFLENLKTGHYDINIKGANSEGIWDETGRVLSIQVIPPWWQSILFRIFLAVAGLTVLIIAYWRGKKFYRSRLKGEIDINRIFSEFSLTKRETEILRLVLEGKSIKGIAQELMLSASTVQKHIYSVYKKLKINNRMQLINLAQRYRLP